MESENLLNFIQETGFRTMREIQERFPLENPEIINAMIEFLTSRNKIRRIRYQSPNGAAVLFYLVPRE